MRPSLFALIGLFLTSSLPAQASLWPSTVLRVERDLRSLDVETRRRAAQSLRDLPASSGARLSRAALDDSDLDVRLSALDACLSLRVPELGERLVPWLSDSERRARLAAAEALSQSPSPRAVAALGRALGDADVAVRSAAATALGKSSSSSVSSGGSGSSEAVLALLGHLDDSSPEVRRDVALALGELGDQRAVVPLIGKIQDARPTVREGVLQALARLGDARASSALVLSLHDADDTVKIAALGALAHIVDPSSVSSISGLLQTGSDNVLPAALDALSRIRSAAAVQALIEQLDSERTGDVRGAAVRALARAGAAALPLLERCLNGESNPERLAGCALALGQTRSAEGVVAIEDALRRGALGPMPALLALSDLRAPESLPTVLEYLSDTDAQVRRAARVAAAALLDPRRPDGRAVEPLEHALSRAHVDRLEQRELLDLLGQTGSPRANVALLPFAGPGDDLNLRSHALSALGFIGDAGQFATLLSALDDDAAPVRLAAAIALHRLPLPGRAHALLDRLQRAAEQDRPLVLLALSGTMSQEHDPRVAALLEDLLRHARAGERDAVIELWGRTPSAEAMRRLAVASAASNFAADRAKFAEALAGQPGERARLSSLLEDPSPKVRANAAWSLGEVGVVSDRAALQRALDDVEVSVAADALQSLARIAWRNHDRVSALVCPRISSPHWALRAAALRALRLTGERCDTPLEAQALAEDRSDFVRQSAAALLRDVARGSADEAALARAREHDPSGAVAAECEAPPPNGLDGVEPTLIMVIAPGEDLPRPAQPFALLRADGLVRFGFSDRRGQVFEIATPRGALSLIEPVTDLE